MVVVVALLAVAAGDPGRAAISVALTRLVI